MLFSAVTYRACIFGEEWVTSMRVDGRDVNARMYVLDGFVCTGKASLTLPRAVFDRKCVFRIFVKFSLNVDIFVPF